MREPDDCDLDSDACDFDLEAGAGDDFGADRLRLCDLTGFAGVEPRRARVFLPLAAAALRFPPARRLPALLLAAPRDLACGAGACCA